MGEVNPISPGLTIELAEAVMVCLNKPALCVQAKLAELYKLPSWSSYALKLDE